jgi:hypothetical protein
VLLDGNVILIHIYFWYDKPAAANSQVVAGWFVIPVQNNPHPVKIREGKKEEKKKKKRKKNPSAH